MARSSFALSTAILFVAFLAVASALPVAERQDDGHDHSGHDHDHSGHDHSEMDKGDSKSKKSAKEEGAAPTVTTSAPGSTVVAAAATGESESSAESTAAPEAGETTSEPEGAKSTSEPVAGTTTPRDDDDESVSSPDGGDDDDNTCFPADARVELEDGSTISMSKLSIGDSVKVGVNQYSKVFMFTHRLATGTHKFVVLDTASGASLALTKGHYIYADGSLVAASEVTVGSSVSLGDGNLDTVVSVRSAMGKGLYNPQTVNGNVVVNNVLASTYTTAVEPIFAHAVLAPFRFLNAIGLHFTSLESGGGVLTNVAPRGAAF